MTASTVREQDVVIIGAGGHARVIQSTLSAMGLSVIGAIGKATQAENPFQVLDDEALIFGAFAKARIAIGIGATPRRGETGLNTRNRIFQIYASNSSERLLTIVDPSSVTRGNVAIGRAAQILAGAVVQTGTRIGENTVANTGCRIDHDCTIGNNAFIGPGAVICGGVSIGDSTFVGANATILPGITVGENAVIAAGSTVTRNVPPGGFNPR